jgi:hypothetical protein
MKLMKCFGFLLVILLGSAGLLGAFGADQTKVSVVSDAGSSIVLHYEFDDYQSTVVTINGEEFTRVWISGEPILMNKGAPALPHVNRSVIIPDDAHMAVKVLSVNYEETHMKIAPSKGPLPRYIDPDHVPYEFGKIYEVDGFYPGTAALLEKPYILRDYRGVVVQINPFQYNPVTGVIRVYKEITIEVQAVGPGKENVLIRKEGVRKFSQSFQDIYRSQFLNFEGPDNNDLTGEGRYDPLDEEGDMLIIAHDPWIDDLNEFISHKSSMGISASVVGVSAIGNDSTSIKNYIQDVYDTSDLAFVLLVGDADQVATPISSGGASDPSYAKLAGDDHYPEIIVGRFSAQILSDLETQLGRTIDYETMPANQMDWFWRGVGIASNQGAGQGDEGQADNEHMAEIRTWLLGAGYTHVDEIYDPTATDAMVTDAVNDGRGIINYCGHGSASSWGTTGFNTADVDALVNDNMLPFISSVACVNGQFEAYDKCFAEAWLRATNNQTGEPTGAIGMYASSVNQSWAPPMEGQDEFNLLLTDSAEPYFSYGAMCFAGSCSMMDDYGAGGVEMFDTWIIFGDPSLRVIGTPSKLTYESHLADESDPDYGNGDGNIDFGETVRLAVTLRNIELAAATNVWAILTTTSAGVEIRDNVAYYPDIPGEGTGESLFPHFTFTANEECGSIIRFKMEIYHDNGSLSYASLSVRSGMEVETTFYQDDMENNNGWEVSGSESDNNWELDDPYEVLDDYGGQIQPEDDCTPDPAIKCWITGNPQPKGQFEPGDGDVDGKAILESPIFDASGATSLTVELERWFYHLRMVEQDNSYMDIAISNDCGANYLNLEEITAQSNVWTLRTLEASIPPTDQMRIRVQVEQSAIIMGEILLEGGIDDLRCFGTNYECESFSMPSANPPNPVGETVISSKAGSCVKLEWQEPSVDASHDAATLYRIYRSNQPDTGFQEIGSCTGTFYHDIDELNGPEDCYYKIVAENGGGQSGE